MAKIENKYCPVCEAYETFINGKCNSCLIIENRNRITLWNNQTVDEQIHDLRRRIEELERAPTKY